MVRTAVMPLAAMGLPAAVMPLAAMALLAAACAGPSTQSEAVDDILSRYVEARGGLEKIRSVESLRQEGYATLGADRNARVMRELKRPGRIRFEFTTQGITAVYASDGERGWQVSPFDEDMGPKPLPDEVVADAMEQADFEGPLVGWKEKGHTVELVGREAVDGKEAYKLKVTLRSGGVRHDYLDVESLHLVRTETSRQGPRGPVQVEATFGDFKMTDGVLFPRTIEVGAAGRPRKLRIEVDAIEVNPPLSDDRFDMPAVVAPS